MRISVLSVVKHARYFDSVLNAICDIVLTVLISAMRALLYYALNAIVKILLSALHAKISHVLNMYTVARSATRNVSV